MKPTTGRDWLHERINHHMLQLAVLSHRGDDEIITCPVCGGEPVAASRSDMCGCHGVSSVADARKFHHAEIAMLEVK